MPLRVTYLWVDVSFKSAMAPARSGKKEKTGRRSPPGTPELRTVLCGEYASTCRKVRSRSPHNKKRHAAMRDLAQRHAFRHDAANGRAGARQLPTALPTRRMPKTTKEGKKKRKETKKPSPVNSAKTRPMNGSNAISRCPATGLPRLFPALTPDARSVCAGHEGKSLRRGCCAASHTSGRP